MSETPTPGQASALPVVRAAVGARLRDVQAASGVAFDASDRRDDADFIVEEPVAFEYGGDPAPDSLAFRLPPTRFVWIAQYAGVVHSVTTTPQLRFADLDASYGLAQQIAAAIDATAWERAEPEAFSEAEVRRVFADPQTRETARLELGFWRAGDVEIVLALKRRFAAGSNRAQASGIEEDSYLVELGISSVELGSRLIEKMYARREAAGNRNEALPLGVWLGEQD